MREIFINTWSVLNRKEKKRFTLLVILDILISLIDILSLAFLLWIVQFYIRPDTDQQLSFLPSPLADKNSVALIAVFFIFFGLKSVAGLFITKKQFQFTGSVAIRISHNKLARYQQTPFADFINTDSSSFIRKIALQPFEFCQHLLSGTQQIITQLFLITIAIIAIVIFNAKVFLFLFIILIPPVILVFYFLKKKLAVTKKHLQSTNERSFQYLLDALKGYVEGNIFGRNRFFLNRFVSQRKQFSVHLFDSLAIQSLPGRIIEVFAILGLFILIAISVRSGNADSSTLITIGAFIAAAYKIIPGIVRIINISSQVRAYEFAFDELRDPGNMSETKKEDMPGGILSLAFKDVGFRYAEHPVLTNLSFTATRGDFTGISGISGKGKTTVLNLILGFLSPEKGQVFINDTATDPDTTRKYWPHMSYVRQQSFFIYDTIIRNITLEEEVSNEEALKEALRLTGLDTLISTFPEGMNKIITENGKNISGGQQQRIAIARALYKNADLILLDEPFNELDEGSVISMLGHFSQLAKKGKIVVMITHDKKSLAYCNKIIPLDE